MLHGRGMNESLWSSSSHRVIRVWFPAVAYVSRLIISKHSLCKPLWANSVSIDLRSVGGRKTEFDDKFIHMPAPLHPRPTFATNRRMFFGFFLLSQIHNGYYASGLKTFILQHIFTSWTIEYHALGNWQWFGHFRPVWNLLSCIVKWVQ